ncbi:dihydropteroate synthase [Shigella flexneri]
MGILNVTPHSFSDGGTHNSLIDAVKRANLIINGGATIIDVGGQSTRPARRRFRGGEELPAWCRWLRQSRNLKYRSLNTSKPESNP